VRAITAIGIGGAIAVLFLAVIMEGGNPASLINIPAFLISIVGTGMAVSASTSIETLKRIPTLYKVAIKAEAPAAHEAAKQMVALSDKARREGLLSLEREIKEIDDDYTKKGLQLVVDGTDSELVSTILESEIESMQGRHAHNAHLFQSAGGFAPTLGIIGTVLSLIHVLENLASPAALGHSIAGAFLATLYGVASANLVYLPVANKLKELSAEEVQYRYMLLDAVLSIQAGDNPRTLGERLETFLPPAERGHGEGDKAKKAKPEAAGEAAPEPVAEAA
jgi:chemotaxis protein MotA